MISLLYLLDQKIVQQYLIAKKVDKMFLQTII